MYPHMQFRFYPFIPQKMHKRVTSTGQVFNPSRRGTGKQVKVWLTSLTSHIYWGLSVGSVTHSSPYIYSPKASKCCLQEAHIWTLVLRLRMLNGKLIRVTTSSTLTHYQCSIQLSSTTIVNDWPHGSHKAHQCTITAIVTQEDRDL